MEQFGVDPTAIPRSMTKSQLEWWILFGICVAGKGAKQTEIKVNALLNDLPGKSGPFGRIKRAIINERLGEAIKKHKLGQYKRISKAFRAVVDLDLDNISIAALEAIPGIGPKTARMIILYYDPMAKCVPLDTHILKYLRANGYSWAPKSTPPAGLKYKLLESAFVQIAHSLGKTVRELDTEVWKFYAKI